MILPVLGLLRRRENLAILDSVSLSSAAAAVSGVGAAGGGDGAQKTGQSINWPVLKKLLRSDFEYLTITYTSSSSILSAILPSFLLLPSRFHQFLCLPTCLSAYSFLCLICL